MISIIRLLFRILKVIVVDKYFDLITDMMHTIKKLSKNIFFAVI